MPLYFVCSSIGIIPVGWLQDIRKITAIDQDNGSKKWVTEVEAREIIALSKSQKNDNVIIANDVVVNNNKTESLEDMPINNLDSSSFDFGNKEDNKEDSNEDEIPF